MGVDVLKTLKDIQYLRLDLKYIEDKLTELRNKMTSITSAGNSDITPGSHVFNSNNKLDNNLVSIEELQKKICTTRKRIIELEEQVEIKLEVLEPKERLVIKLYYFEGETIEYICGVVNYSYRHTKRIYRLALGKLEGVE